MRSICTAATILHLMSIQPLCAQGGRLPKGSVSSASTTSAPMISVTAKPDDPKSKSESQSKLNCRHKLVHPVNMQLFTKGEDLFYLERNLVDSKKSQEVSDPYRYTLYKFNLASHAGNKSLPLGKILLSFTGPRQVGLLVHDVPVRGFTILSFADLPFHCGYGTATAMTVTAQFDEKQSLKPSRTAEAAKYKLVDGMTGRFLVDQERGVVRKIDPFTMQQQVVYQTRKGDEPLYWDDTNKIMFSYTADQNEGSDTVLKKSGRVGLLKIAELPVKDRQRIVQDRNSFGLLEARDSEQLLVLRTIFGWSSTLPNGLFRFRLPRGLLARQAEARVNFAKQHALIFQDRTAENNVVGFWNKLLVYEFEGGLTAQVDIPASEVVADVDYSEGSRSYAIVATEDRQTGVTKGLKLFDLLEKKWSSLMFR